MGLNEALKILAAYRDSILYLIAGNLGACDAEDLGEALDVVISYLNEGGEMIG